MAVFTGHHSWGRTRRPKNIAGADGTALTLESTDGTAPTAVTDGYLTENQRYLHLTAKDNDADTTITIYVYHYAFAKWAKLMIPTDLDGTVTDAYKAATVTCAIPFQSWVFDIAGADRVAFVANNADATTIYAACSTF
jgi:hypothetical protein